MPRTVPDRKDNRYWEPQSPALAEKYGDRPLNPAPSDDASGWVDAPADSHLQDFRFVDATDRGDGESRFVRKFGDLDAGYGRGRSRLYVRFKPNGGAGVTEYEYYFEDAAAGRAVFEELCAAAHPGQVVHHRLIKGGVRYARIA